MLTCSDPAADVAAFKETGAQVLVGTPGRILDVMKRCTAMDLRRLEVRECVVHWLWRWG